MPFCSVITFTSENKLQLYNTSEKSCTLFWKLVFFLATSLSPPIFWLACLLLYFDFFICSVLHYLQREFIYVYLTAAVVYLFCVDYD